MVDSGANPNLLRIPGLKAMKKSCSKSKVIKVLSEVGVETLVSGSIYGVLVISNVTDYFILIALNFFYLSLSYMFEIVEFKPLLIYTFFKFS